MSTLYSVGQMNQLGDAFETAGFTPDEVTKLRSSDLSRIRRLVQGFMVIVEVCFKLVLSKVFNPAEFIGKDWSVWKGPIDGKGLEGEEDRDVREDALTVIEWDQVILETNLQEGETYVKGEDKLCRLKAGKNIRLGGRAFLSLWEDYKTNKADSVLEKLRRAKNVTRIYFFGLTLRSPRGDRYVLYLYFSDGRWCWHYDWLGYDWGAGARSASLTSVS